MSTTTAPTVEQTVARAKREILEDIGVAVSHDGRVMPATVSTFSELHDYVDANTYGGMCDDEIVDSFGTDDAGNDAWTDHCNAVTDALDEWLRAGRPETHVCDCTVCQGITFTAPAGYVTDATMTHNYAQMFRSPMLRVLAERRGLREVV